MMSTKSSRRIYVSNIPPNFTQEQVRAIFDVHGELAGCDLEEDKMNPPKLSAFVTYRSRASVENVLVSPSFEVEGNTLAITPATSQKQQLFVGGYDLYVTQEQLEEFFGQYGQVDHLLMKYNHEGVSRCFGFVTFRDSPDAVRKLASKRFIPCLGKTVEVKFADPTLCPKSSGRPTRPFPQRRSSARSSSLASLEDFVKRRKSTTGKRPRVPSNGSGSDSSTSSDDNSGRLAPRRYVAPHRWKSVSRSVDLDPETKENK